MKKTALIIVATVLLAVMCSFVVSADETIITGSCGADATFSLDQSTGTLTISGNGTFSNANFKSYKDSVKTVIIEEGITSVSNQAFQMWTALEKVSLPESLRKIDSYAFQYCSAMSEINLPSNLTTINGYAFGDCHLIKEINIPKTVSVIQNNAFYKCRNLRKLTIQYGVKTIGGSAFNGCSTLVSVILPESVTNIESNAFSDCTRLATISIPETVTAVSSSAFSKNNYNGSEFTGTIYGKNGSKAETFAKSKGYNFVSYDTLNFGVAGNVMYKYAKDGNLTVFGYNEMPEWTSASDVPWYSYADSITSVIVDRGVKNISAHAFEACTKLNKIIVADTVTSVADNAFAADTSRLVLSSAVGSAANSFASENGIKSVEIIASGEDHILGQNSWYLDSQGVLTISGNGNIYNFSSNSSVPWYTYRNSIKQVCLKYGVTGIGDYSFYGCSNLESVVLPDNMLRIGNYAFYNCKLITEINLPQSTSEIGYNAFDGCANLEKVSFSSNIKSVAGNVFKGCEKLSEINIPDIASWCNISFNKNTFNKKMKLCIDGSQLADIVIPEGITKIPDYSFCNIDIKSVSLPKSLTQIGKYAFMQSDIKEILLPEAVSSVGENAFWGCLSLETITVDKNNTKYTSDDGVLYDIGKTKVEAYPSGCDKKTYTMPATVKTIASGAFYRCGELETVTVQEGNESFYSDENGVLYDKEAKKVILFPPKNTLEVYNIPETVTALADYSFVDASEIRRIYFPTTVVTVPKTAFSNNSEHLDFVCKSGSNVETIAKELGITCWPYGVSSNGTEWSILDGVLTVSGEGEMNSGWKNYKDIEHVIIENGITSICARAFEGYTSLKSVEVSETVTIIGDWAFNGCTALERINIPSELESIGEYSFGNCASLKRVDIKDIDSFMEIEFNDDIFEYGNGYLYLDGKIVEEIEIYDDETQTNALDGVSGVNKVVFAEGVTAIRGFSYCADLKEVHIPSTVETISGLHYSGIERFYVSFENPIYSNDAEGVLFNKDGTELLKYPYNRQNPVYNVPLGTVRIKDSAFIYCPTIKEVNIPESVTTIEAECFMHSSVSTVNFSEGLQEIWGKAFEDTGLKTVKLPSTINRIDSNAFATLQEIRGYYDTYAEIYANSNNIKFVSVGFVPGVIMAGKLENGIRWKINKNDVLDFTGTGEIPNYASFSDTPWAEYADNVKSISLVEGITKIGTHAFDGFNSIEKILASSTIKTIAENAFGSYISDIDVYVVSGSAFESFANDNNCTAIQIKGFGNAGAAIQWVVTADNLLRLEGFGSMYYWDGSYGAPWYNFRHIIETVEISDKITNISAWSFYQFSALKELVIPDSVKHITNYALAGCNSLEELTIPFIGTSNGTNKTPSSVFGAIFGMLSVSGDASLGGTTAQRYTESLGNAEFLGYYIPSSIKKLTVTDADFIPYGAFYNCCIEEINILSNITRISPYAFYNTRVSELNIPISVESIGFYAFNNDTTINYAGTENAWNRDVSVEKKNSITVQYSADGMKTETPVISVSDIYGGKAVEISCSDNAEIFYTLDGEEPSENSNKYIGAFEIKESGTFTVKAMAYIKGYDSSETITSTVTVERSKAPAASVESGIIIGDQLIELSSDSSEANIYYTLDKEADAVSGDLYTYPLEIAGHTWLKAVSVRKGYAVSEAVTYYYTNEYTVPVVTTLDATMVSKNSAVFNAKIENVDSLGIYTLEFVYAKKASPDETVIASVENAFCLATNGLEAETEYICFARVTNGDKVVNGNAVTFKTKHYDIPQSVILDRKGARVALGNKYYISAKVLPETAPNKEVVFTSSDESIAKVTSSGEIQPVSIGTVTITATAVESGVSDTCTIVVFNNKVTGKYDFSEMNMITNLQTWALDGFNLDPDHVGGDNFYALAYLTRWDGLVSEKSDRYLSSAADIEYGYNFEDYYKEIDSEYHIQNVYMIPARKNALDNDEIKTAIMKYGAVTAGYISDISYYSGSNKENYYYNQPWNFSSGNHMVTVVGWDDNYPASNFNNTPEGNGAFIAKNSWNLVGDKGYVYISYYDTHLFRYSISYIYPEVETANNYNSIWQYDILGPTHTYGYKGATYAANVFPQNGKALANDELLKAVSFHTIAQNMKYEIYVVEDFNGISSLENRNLVAKGKVKEMGYHTVELKKDILLEKGTRFGVVVKLISSDSTRKANVLLEKVEGVFNNTYSGDGFVSADGISWALISDVVNSPNTDVCIKAFTDFADINKAQSYVYMQNNETVDCDILVYTNDDIPVDSCIPYHNGTIYSDVVDDNLSNFVSESELPENYDMRELSYTTPVRNQGSFGTCWSFAICASLESNALKRANEPLEKECEDEESVEYVSDFVGAQIRTEGVQGLRFIFSIPKKTYDSITKPDSSDSIGLGFGSVVMPAEYLGENDLTKNTETVIGEKTYKSKVVPAVKLFDISDTRVMFTVCITDILTENYTREYVAVPYITYESDGQQYTVYGEQTSGITVFKIAEMAHSDTGTNETEKEYLYNSILSVVAPEKYPAK